MASTDKHPGGNIVYESGTTSSNNASNLLTMTDKKYVYGVSTCVVILNRYAVSGLDNTKRINGFRLTTLCQIGSNDIYSVRFVTGLSQGKSSYTSISSSARSIAHDGNSSKHIRIIEVLDPSSDEVVWMNNNIDKVISGTDFGIRLYFHGTLIWYAALEIFYHDTGLYVANTRSSSIYVGTAKADALYLANDKIL